MTKCTSLLIFYSGLYLSELFSPTYGDGYRNCISMSIFTYGKGLKQNVSLFLSRIEAVGDNVVWITFSSNTGDLPENSILSHILFESLLSSLTIEMRKETTIIKQVLLLLLMMFQIKNRLN